MSFPWLSVLLPTYNGEKFLPSALNSILRQNDHDIECLAIDDGSTDSTLEILHSFSNKLPIRILQPPRSGNWVINTNYALSIAKGDYICFLHQDDMWLGKRLGVLRHLVEQNPEINLFLHPSVLINEKEKLLGVWRCPLPPYPTTISSSLMVERLLIQNFISVPAPVFKRKTALKVDGLDNMLWYTADWDFWLKIAKIGLTIYYPEPLSAFRIHAGSQTILRSTSPIDFRNQLEIPFKRHFNTWQAPERVKRAIWLTGRFSIEVNIALACIMHFKKLKMGRLAFYFFRLGPKGWYRYVRDSRIRERMSARFKTKIGGEFNSTGNRCRNRT